MDTSNQQTPKKTRLDSVALSRKISITSDPYLLVQQLREELPIFHYKEEIISRILGNNINLITGETGSGKSTQLPQYVYDSPEIKSQIFNITKTKSKKPIKEENFR